MKTLRSVAVLGAGTMGSRIAAHFANAGVPALLLDVLGDEMADFPAQSAWEPACGEGHISGVLEERFGTVVATDVHDYSDGERHPPGWRGCEDFIDPIDAAELDADLAELGDDAAVDWIITNPPFSGDTDRALAFALRALTLARRQPHAVITGIDANPQARDEIAKGGSRKTDEDQFAVD